VINEQPIPEPSQSYEGGDATADGTITR
jgi:hypothetical protein